MSATGARVALIACGAVALDAAEIVKRRGWSADVHGISSDLHMTPREIGPAVERKLRHLLPRYERVVVVYGDCGTSGRLDEVLGRYPAARPAGHHCFQWYSGELYEQVSEDAGAYVLTDWLVDNWERAVVHGLGLDRAPELRDAYFGTVTRVLFVRQHPDEARERRAREIAGWMGKPLEVRDLGIEPLERLLAPLVEELDEAHA